MLPGSTGVEESIRNRLTELSTLGSGAARPLVEEEDLLLRTLAWYHERGGEATLLDTLESRLRAVRTELEHVLPIWEEAQMLDRVARLYDRQRSGDQDPGRFRIIRNQIRHQMEIERRNNLMHRVESRRAPVVEEPDRAIIAAPPNSTGRERGPDDDGDEAAVERTARSTSVQERVGRFAREYLDVTRVPEVPFTALYEAVADYAAREWPQSTERARVENFRYALRRAAPLFGLVYEQGRVRRNEPSREGVSG
jgi:hypothetical protein